MISLRSKITQDVLGYFFIHAGSALYVNELARRFHHESGNLTRKLIQLEKDGVLKSEIKGKEKYYSLNSSFPLIKEYKQIILKSVGLEHMLREAIKEVPGVAAAYLFGSYAADRMDMTSDIDLLAVGNHKALDLQRAISPIQTQVDREINAVNLTPEEYAKRRKTDPFIKSLEHKPRLALV